MPANLTPQYMEAEEAYKRATTADEKIAAVEEMLRTIPKHKGTEKLQADLRKRLARLRAEGRELRKKRQGRSLLCAKRRGGSRYSLLARLIPASRRWLGHLPMLK